MPERVPGQSTRTRRAFDAIGVDFVPYVGAIKDVNLGSFDLITTGTITGSTLVSTVATNTAPLTITSTTVVANLNVDKVDGYDLDQSVLSGASPTFDGTNFTGIPDGALDETYVKADGTTDLSGHWTITTNNITLTAGTLTAEILVSDTIVKTANGAVGAPGYTFTTDATTGFYVTGSGFIGVTVGGVLQLEMGEGLISFQSGDLFTSGTINIVSGSALNLGAGSEVSMNYGVNKLTIIMTNDTDDISIICDDLVIENSVTSTNQINWNGGNGTFRASAGGSATGQRTAAFNYNPTASGNYAFCGGYSCQATASRTVAFGHTVIASADTAWAFGNNFTNAVANSFAVGFGSKQFTINATTLTYSGIAKLGDGGSANYVEISSVGDIVFKGGAGLIFGHMYTNSTIATTLTDQGTWYELNGATAWTAGLLHNCTFSDPAITVLEPGIYEVTWSLSTDFSATPGSKQQLGYGIMIGGAIQAEGQATRTLSNSTDTGNACGVAILDLADNAVISLAARNETSSGKILHVEHGNMTVKQIGGT